MRLAAVAAVLAALALAGPAAGQEDTVSGRALYAGECASCHGSNGEGVQALAPGRGAGGITGLGPPLDGVGALAADFYLRTGYMPLDDPFEQPRRRRSPFSDAQIEALVAYVASFGGPPIPQPNPGRGDLSDGLRLFTEHCAGCHQVVAEGGISTGAVAPPLEDATPVQVAEAVRIGPYLMPRFGEEQLDAEELDSIVAYVEYAKNPQDEGGWSLGHLGPIPEGVVAWLVAAAVLVSVAMVIGSRAKR
jgi:ubiquinol-cytochrome c reductase cytochrome c subunit